MIHDIPVSTSTSDASTILNSSAAGDVIRFEKGGTWGSISCNRNGSLSNPITITSYGSGAKPIFTSRVSIPSSESTSSWTSVGTNIWRMTISSSFYPRIWLNGVEYAKSSVSTGVTSVKRTAFFNGSPQYLYVYATSNPATFYSTVEWSGGNNTIALSNSNYISLQGLDIRGALGASVELEFSNNILIENCSIGKDAGRLGIRSNHANDVTIRNNIIDSGDIFVDDFLVVQGLGDGIYISSASKRWEVYKNIIRNWGHSCIEITNSPTEDSLEDIHIYENLLEAPNVDYCRPFAADYNNGLNIVVERNMMRNCPVQNQIQGRNIIFRYNIIHHITNCIHQQQGTGTGISISGYSFKPEGMYITNNTIADCDGPGMDLAGPLNNDGSYESVQANNIINNIFYGNGKNVKNASYYTSQFATGVQLYVRNNLDVLENTFKNNIFYYPSITQLIVFRDDFETVAEFNTGNNTGNLACNPSLNSSYAAQQGSCANGSGYTLGSGFSQAVNPTSTWPLNVFTNTQNFQWDIGVFHTTNNTSMPYTPSNGTLSNKPYSPTSGVPTDARSYFYDTANFVWRPYLNVSEVLSFLDTATKRTGHFSIIINTGGTLTNGVISGGVNEEYWFKDGYTDGSLTKRVDFSTKQSALVSGQNIKTINGQSILGAGDLPLDSSSSSTPSAYSNTSPVQWVVATTKADGTAITDADVNNILFSKVGGVYYKRYFTGPALSSWWGAVGTGIGDQYPALQQAINDCINARIDTLHIEKGYYYLSEGLVIRRQGPVRGYVFLSLEGDGNSYDPTEGPGTILHLLDGGEACIYLQRVKGITVRNLKLIGQNIIDLTLTQVTDPSTPKSSWAATGVSLFPTAPHAGIVIDALSFGNVANKYAKKSALYNEPTRSGSTQVTISGVQAFKFGTGISVSPANMQNGENIFIEKFWCEEMYCGITTGDSQNRTVQVKNYSGWQKIWTHFDSRNFTGSGAGCPPFVDGFNIAGGSYQLCCNGTWYGNGFSAQRGHAELMSRIGGDPSGQLGSIMLLDCNLDLTGPLADNSSYIRLPNQIVQCRDFMMHNGRIVYYGLPKAQFGFSVKSAYLEMVRLDSPILLGVGGKLAYKHSFVDTIGVYCDEMGQVNTLNVNATILSVNDTNRTWTYNTSDSTIEVGNYVVLTPKNGSDLTGEFHAGNILTVSGGTVQSKSGNLVTVEGVVTGLAAGQNFDIKTQKIGFAI